MSHVTEGCGGRDGAGESDGGRDTWTTVTSKKRAKYKPNTNRASDSESEDPLVKTFRITKDGKSITVTSIWTVKEFCMVKKEISIAAYVELRETTLGLRVQGSFVISAMNMGIGPKFAPLS